MPRCSILSRLNGARQVHSDVTMYTAPAVQIAMNADTAPLNRNRAGSVTPSGVSSGWSAPDTCGQKLAEMIPVTQSVDPVIAPAHAPAAVPLRQYNPPMIAAPAPPVKI